jgi:endonuclease/exonuclease/phosphatase family metal-dependent hydrolase
VFDRAELAVRRVRRALDRDDLTARLLGLPAHPERSADPGLLIVQIDGLARERLVAAIIAGQAPFLRSLLASGSYALTPVYTGMPSVTPAVQAELFYGVTGAVPAFSFVDHASGRVSRMYDADAVRAVEDRLRVVGDVPLLQGGGAYLDIYDAGATHPRFCMASLGWGDVGSSHPLALVGLVLLHAPGVARATGAVVVEAGRGLLELFAALRAGEHPGSELKFVQSRITIGVVLRELCAFGAAVDLARGAPVVHVNLLGYDEMAHRRSPDSELALRSMRPVDAAIRRMARRARRSRRRHYDLWVMADHGQEPTASYVERHGRTVREAVAEVLAHHGISSPSADGTEEPPEGEQRFRARAIGERLVGVLVPGLDVTTRHHRPGQLTVTAQGPLGHVYLPRPLQPDEHGPIGADLVARAHVPLVCAADGTGRALAWTPDGAFVLPDDAAAVLGADHPYLTQVAADLVTLCHHPDAGDLVISGWRDGDSLSFPHEHGAHAGPGPRETDAFLVAPVDTPLPDPVDGVHRFLDVRAAALAVLGRTPSIRRPRGRRPATTGTTVRILTYNVHSCTGMDHAVSPERIARVIARHDPDVVALQELDVRRSRTGAVDQAHEIARHLEMELAFHPTISLAEERFGDAILSRLPMREVRVGMLPELGMRGLEPRGAVWVEVETADGRPLQVVTTHLSLHPREQRMQVEALLGPEWLGDPRAAGDLVLCGDLNAHPWSATCRALRRRLRDAQAGHEHHRPRATFAGHVPLVRIDHLFVSRDLEVSHVEVAGDELARVASDHRPLVVDVRLPGA